MRDRNGTDTNRCLVKSLTSLQQTHIHDAFFYFFFFIDIYGPNYIPFNAKDDFNTILGSLNVFQHANESRVLRTFHSSALQFKCRNLAIDYWVTEVPNLYKIKLLSQSSHYWFLPTSSDRNTLCSNQHCIFDMYALVLTPCVTHTVQSIITYALCTVFQRFVCQIEFWKIDFRWSDVYT